MEIKLVSVKFLEECLVYVRSECYISTRSDDEKRKENAKKMRSSSLSYQAPVWFPQTGDAARKLTTWPLRLTNPSSNSDVAHTPVVQAPKVLVLCCSPTIRISYVYFTLKTLQLQRSMGCGEKRCGRILELTF